MFQTLDYSMRAVVWLRAKRQAQERIERMRALAFGLCVIIPLSPAQAGFASPGQRLMVFA
jgi:hypothetical protein